MEYLVAWRMARARGLFAHRELGLTKVAENASSTAPASTFSTAFTRHVRYDLLDPQAHPRERMEDCRAGAPTIEHGSAITRPPRFSDRCAFQPLRA